MKLFRVFQDEIYKLELYYAKKSIHGEKTLQNDRNESMLGNLTLVLALCSKKGAQ